jgi:CRISPR-associated Cas5-like protein
MLMPVSDTPCRLCSVKSFAALVVPTACFAYVALTGVSRACTLPVPDRATVCGLVGALSVNVRLPVRVPRAVGVKVTFTMQFFPAASVLPQGLVLVV